MAETGRSGEGDEVTVWFSARIKLHTKTHSFVGAEGDVIQAVQNEIGHAGVEVENAEIEP